MLGRMGKLNVLIATLLAATFTAELSAQKAKKPPKTWMDLPVGTDLTWTSEDSNESVGGRGTSKSNNGKHEIRIVSLGATDDGKLRIAVIDEQLPDEPHETAIVHGEIALLDPATGQLERPDEQKKLAIQLSPLTAFPYPPLSSKEFKSKKAGTKEILAPVGGEAQLLSLKLTSGKAKVGRKKVRAVIAEMDPKQPAAIKLAGIAGMVAMAKGQMPKIGASGIEPVDATVTALRREFHVDNKGRVLAVHTTSKFEAGGVMKFEGTHTMKETARRKLKGKAFDAFAETIEEICAITQSREDKATRKQRAEALKKQAKKVGLAPMLDRLIDSLTRSGLPPGIGR